MLIEYGISDSCAVEIFDVDMLLRVKPLGYLRACVMQLDFPRCAAEDLRQFLDTARINRLMNNAANRRLPLRIFNMRINLELGMMVPSLRKK